MVSIHQYERPPRAAKGAIRDAMAAARLSPGNSIGICKGLSVTFDATAAVSDTTAAPVARKTSVDLAREVNRLRSSLISAGRDLDAARASAAYWERIARNLVGAVDSQDSESVAACLADARSAIYGEMSEAC